MIQQEENKEFMSKDINLKLYKELRDADSTTKINAFREYAETIKEKFDERFVEIESAKQLGLIHFEHKEYLEALPYFEKADETENREGKSYGHLNSLLLIRTNRLLKRYDQSLYWFEKALKSIKETDSAFMLLDIIGDYADLCQDADFSFDSKYEYLINKIVQELGFPNKDIEPIANVHRLRELNKYWNVQLCKISIHEISDQEKVIFYKKYIDDCEIKWYKDYVQEMLERLKKNSR
jgi:tetratricopeptide (TPR) repeat protein